MLMFSVVERIENENEITILEFHSLSARGTGRIYDLGMKNLTSENAKRIHHRVSACLAYLDGLSGGLISC
jgi:hypothetical protein